MIKKGWFSDLEILEIHQKTNNEQNTYTVSDTLGFDRHEQSSRNKPPTSENRNTTHPNNTEQPLTQEQKINLEDLKRIMNEQKTTLPSLRNIEWRTIKRETEKINQVLTYIPTKSIIELNELIYEGAKLVSEKIGGLLKSTNKKSKPEWKIRQETQIKKTTKTDKNDKTKEKR